MYVSSKNLLTHTSFRTSKKVWRRIHISLAPLFLSICLRILRVFVLKYFVYLSWILRCICIKYPLVTGSFDKCGGELHITFFALVYLSKSTQSISLERINCICFIFLGWQEQLRSVGGGEFHFPPSLFSKSQLQHRPHLFHQDVEILKRFLSDPSPIIGNACHSLTD